MSEKPFSKIIAVLNTSVSEVVELMKKKGITVHIVANNSDTIEEDDGSCVYGFLSSISLANNIKKLKHPPILWETANVVHHVSLNFPVVYADAKRMHDGLIVFTPFSLNNVCKAVTREFKRVTTFKIEKAQPVQYGNDSEVSRAINNFLVTLPFFTVKPTLVALATSLKYDYNIFNNYLATNRLVTSHNKTKFNELNTVLTSCKPHIEALVKKDKKYLASLKGEDRKNAQRIRFILNYYGDKTLEEFLDSENNVNIEE